MKKQKGIITNRLPKWISTDALLL